MTRFALCAWLALPALVAFADGPGDNLADKVRRIPPPGVAVPEDQKKALLDGAQALAEDIAKLQAMNKPEVARLLPDVEIYHKAVRDALIHNEIYDLKELPVARDLLKQGRERAAALLEGKHPWTTQTGLVARGYRSKIDGSVQPYGIVVPASLGFGSATPPGAKPRNYRLDFWCHGRGEKLTELAFVNGVQKGGTEFRPNDHFLVQLYGRYCCANKFAGEIDCLEVLRHVKASYPIDDNRIVMRGFSMGGAACWQFAVLYTDLWCAAAPGAGFSETADFLKVFQNEPVKPAWYEKKLWRWYDCTENAENLAMLPTVAYSGEIDKQKQAADMMEAAMKKVGLTLNHIIGPKTGHKYETEAKKKINEFVDAAAAKGRNPWPTKIRFVTHTLRYNKMFWVQVDGLQRHWEPGRVEAEAIEGLVKVKTSGVTALEIAIPANVDGFPKATKVEIDGTELPLEGNWTHEAKGVSGPAGLFMKVDGKWVADKRPSTAKPLAKVHGLQGPIDDAFLSSFVFVKPTGKAAHEAIGKWTNSEFDHAVEHWRRQYRGDARIKDDTAITEADIAEHNLVLFGDPWSNAVLGKIAGKLPIKWDDKGVTVGDKTFAADRHGVVLIFPNPLNPNKYVVLNSGFTFREYDYLNNARQIAKLPDFAIIDVTVPVNSRTPGGIADAGFFGERWELTPNRE